MSMTIRVVKFDDGYYYQGEVLPPDQIGPLNYRNIPQGYVTVAAEYDGECPDCFGMGLCSCCDCGHEHDCNTCDGSGKARRDKTICVREEYIFAIADSERQLNMIRDRYGREAKNIANWWTQALGGDA